MHNPKLPNIQTVLLPTVSPIADDVRGTLLQLMCCTLPRHLCP